jgi:hypothetical protein
MAAPEYSADFFFKANQILNPIFYDELNRIITDPTFYEKDSIQPHIRSVSYYSEVVLVPIPSKTDRPAFEVRVVESHSEINEENESAKRINNNEYFLNTNSLNYEELLSQLKKKYRTTNGPPPENPMNVPSNIGNHLRLIKLKTQLINYKKVLERVLAKNLKDEQFENLFTMNLKKSFYEDPLSTLKNIAKVYPNLELNKLEVYRSPEEIQKRIDDIDEDRSKYLKLVEKNKEEIAKFTAVVNKNGTRKRIRLAPMGGKRRLNKKSRRNRKE